MDNDVLRQAPLFSALDDEAATALQGSLAETTLRRGEVLFHEGDSGDRLYIVLEGKVKLGRSSSDGRENLLAIMGPGQMFGELSLFDPGPRSATVTAVTDTVFSSLSHEDLLRWLEGAGTVAYIVATLGLLVLLQGLAVVWKTGERFTIDYDDESVAVLIERLVALTPALIVLEATGGLAVRLAAALADFAGRGWLLLEARAVVLLDVERLGRRAR